MDMARSLAASRQMARARARRAALAGDVPQSATAVTEVCTCSGDDEDPCNACARSFVQRMRLARMMAE
jgi:hypothetical protein